MTGPPAPAEFWCRTVVVPALYRPGDASWSFGGGDGGPLGVVFGAVGGLPCPDIATWTPSTGLWTARDLRSLTPAYPPCDPVHPD